MTPGLAVLLDPKQLTLLLKNKNKQKKGKLPAEMLEQNRYLAAVTTEDVWICYPWEATYVLSGASYPSSTLSLPLRVCAVLILWMIYTRDIDEHDRLAKERPLS
jgi:hypothetical protein